MPSPKKSERRFRSKSPSRKSERSERSRSRSRGRSKSPARKTKQTKVKASPSPTRKASPAREKQDQAPKTPSTPTRRSARLVEKENHVEVTNSEQKSRSESSKPAAEDTAASRFLGALASFLLISVLPILVVFVNEACTKASCELRKVPSVPTELSAYVSWQSATAVLGWVLLHCLLAGLPVGRVVPGTVLSSGKRLKYRCNAGLSLLATVAGLGASVYFKLPVSAFVYANLRQLAVTGTAFSFLFGAILAFRARKIRPSERSPAAAESDSALGNFLMGRELNPRVGKLDLKAAFDIHIGLCGFLFVNGCLLLEARKAETLTPTLGLLFAAQALFCCDAVLFEEASLTTYEVMHEGVGWMNMFANLVFVPFLFTLQTRYLLEHPVNHHYGILAVITLLNMIGYLIFRGSNSQKDQFRRDPYNPALAHLESIPTASGKKLLVSGWWGLCRHPNYLGDIIMGLAWSLYCGFGAAYPHTYLLYLVLMMVLRERQDNAICQSKHKGAWERYCQRVKYRIIPYVY